MPEKLDSIDMMLSSGELRVTVVNSEAFVKADVYQNIVAAPSIGVDDSADVGLAPDDGLQSGFGDDLGVDEITALEQVEDG